MSVGDKQCYLDDIDRIAVEGRQIMLA